MKDNVIGHFLHGNHKDKVSDLIKELMKGNYNICVTGKQSTGKTTFMKGLLEHLNEGRGVTVLDPITQLELSAKHPEINIQSYKEEITFGQGKAYAMVNLINKLEGFTSVLDELDSDKVLSYYLHHCLVSNSSSISTHYASSTDNLVESLISLMMTRGLTSDYQEAKNMILSNLKIDINLDKSIEGKIYLKRISGIVPIFKSDSEIDFEVKDLVMYDSIKNEYLFLNNLESI